jgi:hypothetical protein
MIYSIENTAVHIEKTVLREIMIQALHRTVFNVWRLRSKKKYPFLGIFYGAGTGI